MKKPALLLLAAVLGLAVLLFAPFFFEGRVLWSQDIGRVYYPVSALLRNVLLTRDASPLVWNPNLGAGFPLVADGVSTPFYPLHWPLLMLLSPTRALTAALFLGYLGSALAMAAFARALGLSRSAALVASVAYGWCGFAVGHSVHVNVVAGLPFLPLCLLFLERARKAAAVRNATLAGVSWGLLCLAGHPQVALMAAVLGSAYAVLRLWPRPASPIALRRAFGLMALFLLIGAGLSAVYYLPMAELAGQSVRPESGLSRDQAIAYALPLPHLVTAISPFFFFDAKASGYWGAWNPAEMALYSGLATVTLAMAGVWLRAREPVVRLLAGVAVVSLMLALGEATPLHGWVHWLPVFRSLRAPARYVLLLDFALAVLAAFGLDALRTAPGRTVRRAAWGAAVGALLAFGLPFLEPLWRGQLAGDGWQDADWATGSPFLLAFKWLLPPLWLGLTALWLSRRHSMASLAWPAAGVLLVAVDLGTFAMTSFSPYWVRPEVATRPDAAQALAASAGPGRVYLMNGPEPWRSASDLCLVEGFRSLTSYVSLPLARHAAYLRAFWLSDQTAFGLLDAAAVDHVVDSWKRPLNPRSEIAGEEFSPRHPLVTLGPSDGDRQVRFGLADLDADRLQLVTTLRGGGQIPQGTEVAIVTLGGLSVTPPLRFALRAGLETAERRRDDRTAHAEPSTKLQAWSLVDRSSEGAFYLARLTWPAPQRLRVLTVEYKAAEGRLLLFGGSLRTGDTVTALSPFMNERFRRPREEGGADLFENGAARPRAFAVHRIVRAATATAAVEAVAGGGPSPNEAVVLEDPTAPPPTGAGPSTVSIGKDEPMRVELAADMKGDGYVVLADTSYPGWHVTVDGAPTTLYTANGMFRAVFVPEGRHRVRFEYAPNALYRGLVITLVTAVVALALALVSNERASPMAG